MDDVRGAINTFHQFYEKGRVWQDSLWLGVPCYKLPFDAMVIQEIICEVQPDFIVETGTGKGGSAVFYASICELLETGMVITIDTNPKQRRGTVVPEKIRRRIGFVTGSSVDHRIIERVVEAVEGKTVIVILDSWHTKEHVLRELVAYQGIVSPGSYMIVEDTHVNGHPVDWGYGSGPFEAVQEFLSITGGRFVVDKAREKYYMTFNPSGYLRKLK